MKKQILIISTLITILAFSGADLFAKRCFGGEHGCRGGHNLMGRGFHKGMFFGDPEVMKEKLGISDAQVDKISDINIEYKKNFLQIREKMAPKKIKLQRMLLEDNVNLKMVRKLLEEISNIKIEIRMLRIKQRLAIEKVLTPSQRKRFKGFRMKMGKDGIYPPSPGGRQSHNYNFVEEK